MISQPFKAMTSIHLKTNININYFKQSNNITILNIKTKKNSSKSLICKSAFSLFLGLRTI